MTKKWLKRISCGAISLALALSLVTIPVNAEGNGVDTSITQLYSENEQTAVSTVTTKVVLDTSDENTGAMLTTAALSADLATTYGYTKEDALKNTVTVLDAFVAAHIDMFGEDFTVDPETYFAVSDSGWITRVFGEDTGNVGYYVNNVSGYMTTPLSDGDTVVIFMYGDTTGFSDKYVYVENNNDSVTEGEAFSLDVLSPGYDASWNPIVLPAGDCVVTLADANTNEVVAATKSDENGKVSFNAEKAGKYVAYISDADCEYYVSAPAIEIEVESSYKDIVEKANKQQLIIAEYIYVNQFENGEKIPGIDDTSALYPVISMLMSGYEAPDFYNAVYTKIKKQLAELEKNGKAYDAFTYAKLVMLMTYMGKDATDIGGFDIVEHMLRKETYDNTSPFQRDDTILIALDCGDYEDIEGDKYIDRAFLVNTLADDMDECIENSKKWGVDSVVMCIQPLAKYTEADCAGVDKAKVEEKVDKALAVVFEAQDGETGAIGNIWTTAQVLITMGCYDINIFEDERLIKNEKTLYDYASAYVDVEKKEIEKSLAGFQPDQLLRGLNSMVRGVENRNGIFNPSSEDIFEAAEVAEEPEEEPGKEPEEQPKDEVKLKSSMIKKIPNQNYTGKAIQPKITVTAGSKVLKKGTDYTVKYSNNKKLGTAKVTVTGKGSYSGTVNVSFKIVLKKESIKKLTAGKKKLTVTFARIAGAKTYQIQTSTDKRFKKNVKSKVVKTTKATFTKLKKGKRYYVRVRALRGKSKGLYSKTKSIRVK